MFRYLKITFITLICLIACLIIYTCMSTQFSFKDITSERIPILQNRPTNIEKDIVVDLTMI